VGVQFAAWGQTTTRFYTGSSDGKVKAWNIKNPPAKAFIRNVLSLAGAVISGTFSQDFSKLLIGDATGKVHLLSINDSDLEGGLIAALKSDSSRESTSNTMENGSVKGIKLQQLLQQKNGILSRAIKRPKVILPHKEPPPPEGYEINQEENTTSANIAQHYLNEGWLEQHARLGVYQGTNYAAAGWYDRTAHEAGNPDAPLLPQFREKQQFIRHQKNNEEFDLLPRVRSSDPTQHEENMKLDLNFAALTLDTQQALTEERVETEGDFSHTYSYEFLPNTSIWSRKNNTRSESWKVKLRKEA
jgi:hypothetical protein